MKRYVCNNCSKTFQFSTKPSFCPFCGSGETIDVDVQKARKTALAMVSEYNEIIIKLQDFADEYNRLSTRAGKIRKALASYKCKGVITETDLPYTKNEPLLTQVKNSGRKKGNS